MPDLRYVKNDQETSIKAMTRTIGILIFPDFQLLDAAGGDHRRAATAAGPQRLTTAGKAQAAGQPTDAARAAGA